VKDTVQRCVNLAVSGLTQGNVIGRAVDAVEIFARCEELFAYARGEAVLPPEKPTSADIMGAISRIRVAIPNAELLQSEVNRRAADLCWPEN
jgi:hypothetical protein